LLRKPNPRGAVLALSALTTVTSLAALASGLVLAAEHEHSLLGWHKNAAIAMTVVCVALPLLAVRAGRGAFRVALLLAIGLSVWAGHLGGSMTHRSGFLLKPLDRGAQAPTTPEGDAPDGDGPDQPDAPPTAADTHFAKMIAPIFERTCNECHRPDAEDGPAGDLILTTREGILCLDRDEADRVIVPGDAAKSYLVQLCEYPLDDDDHMPPKDEPQPTKAELDALRRWIDDGAKFD